MGNYDWKFSTIGGMTRVNIERGEDIRHLAELDEKLWTVLSCPVSGMEFDEKTLKYIDTDNDGHIWEAGSNANYVWLASALNDEKFKICPSQNNWGGWVRNGSGAISALDAPVRFKATATDVDGVLYIEAWYTYDVESDNPTWTPITYTVDGVVVSGPQSTGKSTSIFGNGIGFRAGHTHSGAQIWDIVAYETADPTNVVFNSNGNAASPQ